MKNLKKLQHNKIVTLVFLGLIFVFLFIYMKDFDYDKLKGINLDPLSFVIACTLALSFRYWGAFIWQTILKQLGATNLPTFYQLSKIYAKAWMGRYLPAPGAWIAGKVYFASSHGVSKKKLAVSSVLEAVIQVIAILAVSFIFLAFDDRFSSVNTGLRLIMLVIGVSLGLTVVPPIFNKVMALALKILKKTDDTNELIIDWPVVTRAFGMYSVGYFLSGASYFFFVDAIHPVSFNDFFYIMALFNVAGAIGIASIFAPSGIGVREGIQLVLLVAIMPKELALLVTATSRLFSTVIDIIFFGTTQLIPGGRKSEK